MPAPRRLLAATLTAGLLAGAAYTAWRRTQAPAPLLPELVDPGPGPRAPANRAFGVALGEARFEAIEALAAARGLSCRDTSARALMQRVRAENAAKGGGVDAVSRASAKVSPMEQNPQVRFTCEGVDAERLGDRPRPPAAGRWLFVFDGPEAPLRHVSYRRQHAREEAALADAESAAEALIARFGPPHRVLRGLPPADTPSPLFPRFEPVELAWRFADLSAAVRVMGAGAAGIDVYEVVEVPWPVRADAPAEGILRGPMAEAGP